MQCFYTLNCGSAGAGLRFFFLVGFGFAATSSRLIGPPLHHLPAFRQVLRMIVSGPDRVPLTVGQLTLDDVGAESMLVQNGAGGAAEPGARCVQE